MCRCVRGVLGAGRDSRYSGTRRSIGLWGAPRDVGAFWGCQGHQGV